MDRRTVYCIVEGQTENAFLKQLLGEHLATRGIDFHAPIVKTKGGRGGVKFLRLDDLVGDIQKFLRDRRLPHVTTFLDYYALPTAEGKGWEFVADAKSKVKSHGLEHVLSEIEGEIRRQATDGLDVQDALTRCAPYIQVHELEALFFAEPSKLADALEQPGLSRHFEQAVKDCGGCETINDRPQYAPSKRLQSAAPHYIKGRSDAAHAPIIAKRLDLAVVRQQCPRFNLWLQRLEALAS